MRIPNLEDVIQQPVDDMRVEALFATVLSRVFESSECELLERLIEWLSENNSGGQAFSTVCIKLADLKVKVKSAGAS